MNEDSDTPVAGDGAPAPDAPDTTTQPPGGAPDAADTTPDPQETPEQAAERIEKATQRRFAKLTAKVAAQAAVIERLNSGQPNQPQPQRQVDPQLTPEQQAYVDQRVAAEVAHRTTQQRAQAFHDQGRSQYPDWEERTKSLIQMGADGQFAELLIEIPNGARVAAALADDPAELERIAGLRSERARAIELGKYAATLAPTRRSSVPNVTRAPAPVRPVGNAPARAEFNEYTASADELAEYYSKKDMDARRR